jgi:hypothetical protein
MRRATPQGLVALSRFRQIMICLPPSKARWNMKNGPDSARMSVRILDDGGGEIASFFSDRPEADEGGFSAGLRDALLAFRKKYPKTRFIDVEFKGTN